LDCVLWLNTSILFEALDVEIKGWYLGNIDLRQQRALAWFYVSWIIAGPVKSMVSAIVGRSSELGLQFEFISDELTHEFGTQLTKTQYDSREAGMKLFDHSFVLYPRFERWGTHYIYHENVRILPLCCGPLQENQKGWEWNGGFDKGDYKSVRQQLGNTWYTSWSIKNNPNFS
jgi:hypothetical protein